MKTKAEETFIDTLLVKARIAEGKSGNPGDARRDLAELRSVLRGLPYDLYRAGKHIVPALDQAGISPDGSPRDSFREQCYYQVAGLFAWAYREVKQSPGVSFGAAVRNLRQSDKGTDSLDGRFLALLNSSEDQLFDQLRRLIGLLQAAGNMALDWTGFLKDIQRWNWQDKPVQRRWARDYYRAETKQRDTDSNGDNDTEDEGE